MKVKPQNGLAVSILVECFVFQERIAPEWKLLRFFANDGLG